MIVIKLIIVITVSANICSTISINNGMFRPQKSIDGCNYGFVYNGTNCEGTVILIIKKIHQHI
jgi:hypothetical protein